MMSTTLPTAQLKDELVSCRVCRLNYRVFGKRPLVLGCKHTFCEPCLTHLLNKSQHNCKVYQLTCPTCDQVTSAKSTSDLAVNVDLLKLVDSARGYSQIIVNNINNEQHQGHRDLHQGHGDRQSHRRKTETKYVVPDRPVVPGHSTFVVPVVSDREHEPNDDETKQRMINSTFSLISTVSVGGSAKTPISVTSSSSTSASCAHSEEMCSKCGAEPARVTVASSSKMVTRKLCVTCLKRTSKEDRHRHEPTHVVAAAQASNEEQQDEASNGTEQRDRAVTSTDRAVITVVKTSSAGQNTTSKQIGHKQKMKPVAEIQKTALDEQLAGPSAGESETIADSDELGTAECRHSDRRERTQTNGQHYQLKTLCRPAACRHPITHRSNDDLTDQQHPPAPPSENPPFNPYFIDQREASLCVESQQLSVHPDMSSSHRPFAVAGNRMSLAFRLPMSAQPPKYEDIMHELSDQPPATQQLNRDPPPPFSEMSSPGAADSGLHLLRAFGRYGEMSTQPGTFRCPTRISVSPGGYLPAGSCNVVVSDAASGTVQVFTEDGQCTSMLRADRVRGCCLWTDGKRLVTATDNGIEVFDMNGCRLDCVSIGPVNNIALLDNGIVAAQSNSLSLFQGLAKTLTKTITLKIQYNQMSPFQDICDVAVNSQRDLIVLEASAGGVITIMTDGGYIKSTINPARIVSCGPLVSPCAIAIDSSLNMLVSDSGKDGSGGRILVFGVNGTLQQVHTVNLAQPAGLAVGPDRHLYVLMRADKFAEIRVFSYG